MNKTNEELRRMAEMAQAQQQVQQTDAKEVATQAQQVREAQTDNKVHVVVVYHSAENAVKEDLDDHLVLLKRRGDAVFHDHDLSKSGQYEEVDQFISESVTTGRKVMILALISPKLLRSDIVALRRGQVRLIPVRMRAVNLSEVDGLARVTSSPSSMSDSVWACDTSGGKRDSFLMTVSQEVRSIIDRMK